MLAIGGAEFAPAGVLAGQALRRSHVQEMYFLLDPDPIGKPEDDSFVFAGSHERIETLRGRETFAYQPIVAKAAPTGGAPTGVAGDINLMRFRHPIRAVLSL